MTLPRCDGCGKEFDNEYHLRQQRKCRCEGDRESTDGTEASETTGTDESVSSRADGTVNTFFEEDGYGFLVTADVTNEGSDGTEYTRDIFVHISNTDAIQIEERDRLAFEVVETDEGLAAEDATVLKRARDRDEPEGADSNPVDRLQFGGQVDDNKCGVGKQPPTESNVRSFDDKRKFR